MKFSFKQIAAGVVLAVGSLAANATVYDISYTAVFENAHDAPRTTATYTLTGQVEGVLQGDGNTVLVSDILSWTINGDTFTSSSFAGGGIGSFTQFVADGTYDNQAVFTLDGSFFDVSAGNASTGNYIEFATDNPYVDYADFAYYDISGREYGFVYGSSDPLNGSWSMTPVTSVPEPATALLMLAGVPLLAARRRKAASQAA